MNGNGDGKAVGRWQSAGIVQIAGGPGVPPVFCVMLYHDRTAEIKAQVVNFTPEKPPMIQPVGAIQRVKP